MSEAVHGGGCFCGAIRYRITGAIPPSVHCHCVSCRRASGGLFVTWATVSADGFVYLAGEPARFASSPGVERTFCPTCGASLTYVVATRADEVDVTVATLDRPEDVPADRHVWIADAVPGLRVDEALPRHAGFTPPAASDT